MRIYDLAVQTGQFVSFEVSSALGRKRAARVVRQLPGVQMLREPRKWFDWWDDDEFCAFELEGVRFVICEPFGDSSRYWVGPMPAQPGAPLSSVRAAFAALDPWGIRTLANWLSRGARERS